ncbi:electron transfer flavoprotein subunit alpha/FixB family protein, partial [Streptomyces sp. NPDC000594]
MGEVLVFVGHDGGVVGKPSLELLTVARRLGDPVALVVGAGASGAVGVLAEHGAVRVLVDESPVYGELLVVPAVDALEAAWGRVEGAVAVLVPSTPEGRETAARFAVRAGSGIVTDAVDVEASERGPVAVQSVFAGSFTTRSRVTRGVPVITVKPNAAPVEVSPAAGTVEVLEVVFGDAGRAARVVERSERAASGRPELTEAAIVVSGGRG